MPAPHTSTRSRWRTAAPRWAARQQRPSQQTTLRQRNIYVLPSGAGVVLAIALLVLLVASINFQLNLGYALTFLIAGSALASLWMGHRNIRALTLRLGTLQPVFQGSSATIPVVLQTAQGHPQRDRHGLSVALQRSAGKRAWVHADVAAQHSHTIALSFQPTQRGWHTLPRVVIESRFPLGVFRLWSYWQPASRLLVYPAPETPMPPILHGDAPASGHSPPHSAGTTEHDGVRSYQRGDALRSVVWKKTATALATGSGDLVVRDGAAAPSSSVWLDAQATGLHATEAQIARLTAWVLHAHAQQWPWGLRLPSGLRIAPATGTQHLQACLSALAVDGLPT